MSETKERLLQKNIAEYRVNWLHHDNMWQLGPACQPAAQNQWNKSECDTCCPGGITVAFKFKLQPSRGILIISVSSLAKRRQSHTITDERQTVWSSWLVPWRVSCLDSLLAMSMPFFSQASWGLGIPSAWQRRLAVTPGSLAWLSGYTRMTGGTEGVNKQTNKEKERENNTWNDER